MKTPLVIKNALSTSGIQIDYVKSRKAFSVFGWYNSSVGIDDREITLKELLEHFGITAKDCQKVLKR